MHTALHHPKAQFEGTLVQIGTRFPEVIRRLAECSDEVRIACLWVLQRMMQDDLDPREDDMHRTINNVTRRYIEEKDVERSECNFPYATRRNRPLL